MKIKETYLFADRWATRIIDLFLAAVILCFALLINISIFGRIFHFPTPWVEELCINALPWIGLLGFARAIDDHETIAITALLDKFGRFRFIFEIVNYLISLVIGIFLIYFAFTKIIRILGMLSLSSVKVNMNVFYHSLTVGGALIVLASVKQIVLIVLKLRRSK